MYVAWEIGKWNQTGGLGYKEVHTEQFHFSTNKMSYHRWRREETVLHQDVSSSY